MGLTPNGYFGGWAVIQENISTQYTLSTERLMPKDLLKEAFLRGGFVSLFKCKCISIVIC